MAVNRYARDYKLTESLDEKGNLRAGAAYIGAAYRFQAGPGEARAAAKHCALLAGGAWLGLFSALLPRSLAMHRLWSALPAAFSLLPLWLLSSAILPALRGREPMERREGELLNQRFPAAAFFHALLSGAALLAALIGLLAGEAVPLAGDFCFFAGELISALCAILCFRQRKRLAAETY